MDMEQLHGYGVGGDGGFIKIFTGTTQPTNPKEGDIWVKDNISIKNTICVFDVPSVLNEGTAILLISKTPNDQLIKYNINIMNRSKKISIYNYIRGIVYQSSNGLINIASKIYIGASWKTLSGLWDGEDAEKLLVRTHMPGPIIKIERYNSSGIKEVEMGDAFKFVDYQKNTYVLNGNYSEIYNANNTRIYRDTYANTFWTYYTHALKDGRFLYISTNFIICANSDGSEKYSINIEQDNHIILGVYKNEYFYTLKTRKSDGLKSICKINVITGVMIKEVTLQTLGVSSISYPDRQIKIKSDGGVIINSNLIFDISRDLTVVKTLNARDINTSIISTFISINSKELLLYFETKAYILDLNTFLVKREFAHNYVGGFGNETKCLLTENSCCYLETNLSGVGKCVQYINNMNEYKWHIAFTGFSMLDYAGGKPETFYY